MRELTERISEGKRVMLAGGARFHIAAMDDWGLRLLGKADELPAT